MSTGGLRRLLVAGTCLLVPGAAFAVEPATVGDPTGVPTGTPSGYPYPGTNTPTGVPRPGTRTTEVPRPGDLGTTETSPTRGGVGDQSSGHAGTMGQTMNMNCKDTTVVPFRGRSSVLNTAAKSRLKELANWAKGDDSRLINIQTGGNDTTITSAAVGDKRAEAARSYLITRGVPSDRVMSVSEGAGVTLGGDTSGTPARRGLVVLSCQRPDATASMPPGTAGPSTGAPTDATAAPPVAIGVVPVPVPSASPSAAPSGVPSTGAGTSQGLTYDPTAPGLPADPTAGTASPSAATAGEGTFEAEPSAAARAPVPDPAADRRQLVPPVDPVMATGEQVPLPATSIPRPAYSVAVGGGVTGFVDEEARQFTDNGASWDARVGVGTRSPVAFEAAYIGSAQNIKALGLDQNALLVGNGAEGNLRVNLTTMAIQPYVFGGVGWTNYRIARSSTALSSLRNSDNVFTVPFGVGLAVKPVKGFLVDLRGTGRAAFDDGLMDGAFANTGKDAKLHQWNLGLRLGYEF